MTDTELNVLFEGLDASGFVSLGELFDGVQVLAGAPCTPEQEDEEGQE